MATAESYYVRRRGKVEGPWPVEKLRAEVSLRKLGRHHEVSVDGVAWQSAGTIGHLFAGQHAAAPVPTGQGDLILDVAELEPDSQSERRGRPETKQASPSAGASYGRGQWYYYCDGKRQGPAALEVLIDEAASGRLTSDALVWKEGMPDWLPAEQITELSALVRDQGDTASAGSFLDGPTHDAASRTDRDGLRVEMWAIAAAAFGSVVLPFSLIPGVGVLGFVSVTLGVIAKRRLRRSGGLRTGGRWANVGIVTGGVSLVITMISAFYYLSVWW